MSRIKQVMADAKARGRKALIPYICAGDPNPDITLPLMHALVAAGSDIIELGVPFSDPMADGPVIQRAAERALKFNLGLDGVIAIVAEFRKTNATTPVVLMGYANPIERMGMETFAATAKAAGVDGVLVVDYPPEECEEFAALMKQNDLDPIFLLAPTSTDARIDSVARAASHLTRASSALATVRRASTRTSTWWTSARRRSRSSAPTTSRSSAGSEASPIRAM